MSELPPLTVYPFHLIFNITEEQEFDKVVELLNDGRYCWLRTRIKGYFSLGRILKWGRIDKEMCVRIAHGLAKRIEGIHSRNLAHDGLRAKDVFVKRHLGCVRIKSFLSFIVFDLHTLRWAQLNRNAQNWALSICEQRRLELYKQLL